MFAFHPELFEYRTLAMEKLSEHDLEWFSHYSSVDLIHEEFGLEVCGIRQHGDALTIQRLLRKLLPGWRHSWICEKTEGDRDLGWQVVICRDEQGPQEDWQRV